MSTIEGFSGELHLIVLFDRTHPATRRGRSLFAVGEPFTYTTWSGDRITVPKGFVTDLASIPWFAQLFFLPAGPWSAAAAIHDAVYKTEGTGIWRGEEWFDRFPAYSRSEADQILLQAMTDLEVPAWRRFIIWSAVRAAGWLGWGS